MRSRPARILFLCMLLLLISCAGKSLMRQEKLVSVALRNEFITAVEIIRKNPKLYGKLNQFLYNMDIGVLYHYAGEYDSSDSYLLAASDIYDELFTRSVTNEAAAILVNDNVRPYRSMPFEIVLLHQLIAFNFLAAGKNDEALVETRKVQLYFNDWEKKNKNDFRYHTDGMFHYISSIAYDQAGEWDNAMISLYKAVDAFKNGGGAGLPQLIENYAYYQFQLNDRAADIDLLKIKADKPKAQVAGLGNNNAEIIVIGYAGRGPALDQNTWWGTYVKDGFLVLYHTDQNGKTESIKTLAPPLPDRELKKSEKGRKTSSGTTFHLKFALPAVKSFPSITQDFQVTCSGTSQPVTTVVINDFEKQLTKYLEDTRNATIARTAVRVVLRTIAAQRAKEQMRTENSLANLILNVGADLLSDQMENADTRNCFLIPKTVQIARIPVSAGSYDISVAARDRNGNVLETKKFSNITVEERKKRFIFYTSLK